MVHSSHAAAIFMSKEFSSKGVYYWNAPVNCNPSETPMENIAFHRIALIVNYQVVANELSYMSFCFHRTHIRSIPCVNLVYFACQCAQLGVLTWMI